MGTVGLYWLRAATGVGPGAGSPHPIRPRPSPRSPRRGLGGAVRPEADDSAPRGGGLRRRGNRPWAVSRRRARTLPDRCPAHTATAPGAAASGCASYPSGA